ncbi:YgaP-like transmembrane domain [Bradyrhizobium sp. HKCCYLS3077]|uniref:YgaP-like transmembrane domain n=1 Tax=Bradyrhizobium sp. HKCCYLS3077 TaxID=3420761 RepID=UPI003EB99F3A
MAWVRRNLARPHRWARLALGLGAAAVAVTALSGAAAWLAAAGGVAFALSGAVGYCPVCAVTGIGTETARGGRS